MASTNDEFWKSPLGKQILGARSSSKDAWESLGEHYGYIRQVVARKYFRQESQDELEALANRGFVDAVATYDPSHGTKFRTHVYKRINYSILRAIEKNRRAGRLILKASLDNVRGEDGRLRFCADDKEKTVRKKLLEALVTSGDQDELIFIGGLSSEEAAVVIARREGVRYKTIAQDMAGHAGKIIEKHYRNVLANAKKRLRLVLLGEEEYLRARITLMISGRLDTESFSVLTKKQKMAVSFLMIGWQVKDIAGHMGCRQDSLSSLLTDARKKARVPMGYDTTRPAPISEKDQKVITLYRSGESLKKIAKETGASLACVKAIIHRARRRGAKYSLSTQTEKFMTARLHSAPKYYKKKTV